MTRDDLINHAFEHGFETNKAEINAAVEQTLSD